MDTNISKYLKSGSQTEITSGIQKIAESFHKEGIDLIFEILKWLCKNLKMQTDQNIKNEIFRKRTADEIIKSGFATGCTDWALVFISFARAKNIPTVYVETIRRRWLEEGDENNIEGHIFAEVYLEKKWYIIDPEQNSIKGWYDKYVVFKKGMDSWDIGINSFEELKRQFVKFKQEYK